VAARARRLCSAREQRPGGPRGRNAGSRSSRESARWRRVWGCRSAARL